MNELAAKVAILVNLFLRGVCLNWHSLDSLLVNTDNHENWGGIVATQDLVDFNIGLFDLRSCRVPAYDFLLEVNLAEHLVHAFVVDVVEEPDVWLISILFEWNRVAVCDIQHTLVSVLAQQNANNALFGPTCDPVIVIHYRQQHRRVHYN
jgi:hypothetical protein